MCHQNKENNTRTNKYYNFRNSLSVLGQLIKSLYITEEVLKKSYRSYLQKLLWAVCRMVKSTCF